METIDIPNELAVLEPVVAEHVDGRGGFAIIVVYWAAPRPAPAGLVRKYDGSARPE